METNKQEFTEYIAPRIEVMEIAVERGFAVSFYGDEMELERVYGEW